MSADTQLKELVKDLVRELWEAHHQGRPRSPEEVCHDHPDLLAEVKERFQRLMEMDELLDASPAAEATPPAIDGYEILDLLGQGGMGVVYKARQLQLDRVVALKMIVPERRARARDLNRFRREARAIAQLQHPHIVQVFEVGEHAGQPYFVLEFCGGGSLRGRIGGTPLAAAEAASLAEILARAIYVAHQHQIIHRDLKPGNVLLTVEGQPKIADFGLAKLLDQDCVETRTGEILGTPSYMAPEQADGKNREVGPAADIHALGAILYECLTGRPPFQAETTLDTVLQVVREEPVPPRRLQSKVPRDLETICLKCLQKEPRKRYGTTLELAEDLLRFQKGEPIQARRVRTPERAWRWCRRNPSAAGLIAAAFLAVVLGFGGILWFVKIQAENEAALALERGQQDLKDRHAAEVELRRSLEQARHHLENPIHGRRQKVLTFLKRALELRRQLVDRSLAEQFEPEIRGLFAESLSVPDQKLVQETPLPHHFPLLWYVALHPDGNVLAIGCPERPLCWMLGKRPPSALQKLDPKQLRSRLWYNPDGRHLLFAPAGGGLQVWDAAATRRLKVLSSATGSPVLAVGFDQARQILWSCREDGKVQSWQGPDFQEGVSPEFDDFSGPLSLTAAAFSTDGRWLAVADRHNKVRLIQMAGASVRQVPGLRPRIGALAWSPSGRLLAIGMQDGTVEALPVDDPAVEGSAGNDTSPYRVAAFAVDVGTLCFHPNEQWLLAGNRAGGMKMFDVSTGKLILEGGPSPWGFARDGRRFAAAGYNSVGFFDLLLPETVRWWTGHRAFIEQMVWGPDHKHLATIDTRFVVRVWDVGQGTCGAVFSMVPRPCYASNVGVAVSSDGQQLAYADSGEACVLEVATKRELERWDKLPFALGNRLAWVGKGKFLLVREEREKGQDQSGEAWQGVAYELQVGQHHSPRRWIVRPRAESEKRLEGSGLTFDGKYYGWWGPSSSPRRFGVYEMAGGRRVYPPDQTAAGMPLRGTGLS
jgi:WD40 repeat protein